MTGKGERVPLGGEGITEERAITARPEASAERAAEPSPETLTAPEPLPEIEMGSEAPSALEPTVAAIASAAAESDEPGTEVAVVPDRAPGAPEEVPARPPSEPREPEAAPRATAPAEPSPGTPTAPQTECNPAEVLVLRHPAVSRPLELTTCALVGETPKKVAAPPVSNLLVELVQHHLHDLGYGPGPLDGLIGPRTLDAVRRFQRDEGLAATGVLSFELLERLQTAQARGQTREVPITGSRPRAEGGRP